MNYYLSEKITKVFSFKPCIQCFLFHKVYKNRSDVNFKNGAPLEAIDINQFEIFIKFFVERNVVFIDENDILEGRLEPHRQYIYLTFDDGYYNNFWCLDVLEKYKVKSTFMISTNHVKENKAYWWDVVYREMAKNPKKYSIQHINKSILELHTITWRQQEDFIIEHFGLDALIPKNDFDRPMNISELKLFAKHPYVTLGNHTHNHLNLTLYNKNEVIESITTAEDFLKTVTKQKISSISYPYGYYTSETVDIMKELQYKIGVTINMGKNHFSELEEENSLLTLKRNEITGYMDIIQQCRSFHTDFSLYSSIKNLKW